MTYEIGQKVETPLGVGIIYTIQTIKEQVMYKVEFEKTKLNFLASFVEEELKPYKTAHERLIEMGFTYIVDYYDYSLFHNEKTNEEVYVYHNKTYDANINITLELSRILTQYLEEMAE